MLIFNQVVQSDPKNEQAWLWLVACQETDYDKIECLKKALSNLPASDDIRFALAKLEYREKKREPVSDGKQATNENKFSRNENKSIASVIFSVILKILLYALIIFGGIAILYFLFLLIFVKTYDPLNIFSGWISLFLGSGTIIAILVIGLRIAIGSWAARIMKNKGRSEGAGWAIGIFLGLIGVIITACLSTDENAIMVQKLETGETRICAACRMAIDAQASICPYCRTQQK